MCSPNVVEIDGYDSISYGHDSPCTINIVGVVKRIVEARKLSLGLGQVPTARFWD